MALAGLIAAAAPASAPTFDGEQLHYAINWPSGLSLGEVQLRSTRVKPTPKSAERYDFEFSIDAAIPGFSVSDRYHSEASKDFCSIDFEKNLTLQRGVRMLRAEGCVQLPLDHSFVGSILPLGHFQSYLGRSAAYSPDEGRYQRYRCMVCYR